MKKQLFITSLILAVGAAFSIGQQPTDTTLEAVPITTVNILANTTNSTPSAAYFLPRNGQATRLRLTASGVSTAASTSNLVFKFTISIDGTNYTAVSASNIKLTVPIASSLGTTNVVSDWFYLNAVKTIRLDTIENPGAGNVSNMTVFASFN